AARSLNIAVDVVPLGDEEKNDVSLDRLQLPSNAKRGQPFEVKVFVQATRPGSATLSLYRDEHYLGSQTVHLDAGKNLFTFPQTLAEGGFYRYDARIDAPGDEVPQNNRALAFTQVGGVPRVLILSSDPAADAPLANALKSPDLQVRLAPMEQFPESLAELQSYDAILLCNVLAGDLSRDQLSRLESAVRDFGTGFVCVGGDQAYAAGAYRGTPLADLLPVEVELSSKKALPPGALVLVIDQSGSMDGEKLEMARQAAAGAVQALSPTDYAGVIAFDTVPWVITPLQPAGTRRGIVRDIMGIGVGGGTVMYPALAEAREMLRNVHASLKHCIVLTDGVSEPGDFAGIAKTMASERITLSTVGIGEDTDGPLLKNIASLGGGRYYAVPNPRQLPQIFIKETAIVLKSAIDEESFKPRLAANTEPVRGIAAGDYPALLGHVVTELKGRAETPLLAPNGDPLLAHWQYGLGRSVAFTSDARAKWARDWLGWGQYQQFWRQVVQWSLRRLENPGLAVEVTVDHGEGRINAEALDAGGNFRNFLNLGGEITTPAGTRLPVRLQQTGAGHYEAGFAARETGAYLLRLEQRERGEIRAVQIVGASLNHSPELETSGPNLHLLRQIAETTGGKVLDLARPGSPFYEDRQPTWQPRDLWQDLLGFAIILFVFDVGVRRISLDPEQMAKAWKLALGLIFFLRKSARNDHEAQDSALATVRALREEHRVTQTVLLASDPANPSTILGASDANAGSTPPGPGDGMASRILEARRRSKDRRV
ncbi:MAG TPA: VWA domain-containing protein, partial [Verrucomicrobiae bacterium]|nr:VWA domain-containing protein [Verrucomicrobiae bacterium]